MRKNITVIAPDFWMPFEQCLLGELRIVTASRTELAQSMMVDCLAAREITAKPRLLFDVNGHGLSLRASDQTYRPAMDAADILHADGGFLVSLSRMLTKK